eukprot:SAG31_NODE_6554_length_1979_cov_4.180851_1_plen_315_part_00
MAAEPGPAPARARLDGDAAAVIGPAAEPGCRRRHHAVYAVHKPSGVLSTAGTDAQLNRRTLMDLMEAAGVPPVTGHAGRLDEQTSGLILVTSHVLLQRAVCGQPGTLEKYGGRSPAKRYVLLLAGRHEAGSAALASLAEPITVQRGTAYAQECAGAAVRHVRCFQDAELAAGGYQRLGLEPGALAAAEAAAAAARESDAARLKARYVARGRGGGAARPAHVPHGGWLTEVELTISQGRHHQIRRLAHRAGLQLRHLHRASIGPVSLDLEGPAAAGAEQQRLSAGGVRVLSGAERRALYEVCMPMFDADVDAPGW